MSVFRSIPDGLPRRFLILAALFIALSVYACDCGEEPEERPEPGEVIERDRSAEIPEPEIAGAVRDDFDPDDRPRIVEPDHWQITMRQAGIPGAMPAELVVNIDRSVVRRGHPQIGPGTAISVRSQSGDRVDVGQTKTSDNFTVFRTPFEGDLEPGTSYNVRLETLEFVFGQDAQGEDDVEIVEFDDPPEVVIETPPLKLVDISSARPVGAFGHVELRFSAPVAVSDVEQNLQWSLHRAWSLDDPTPATDVTYHREDDRVIHARIRSVGSNFANDIGEVSLAGGQQLVSSLGGSPLGEIDESLAVGTDSETLEIRAVGVYDRGGAPTVRVLCHDPAVEGDTTSQWDREIRTRIRDVSRRCDVDAQRALELVELDVEADLSVVDHQHGFDLVLDTKGTRGPVGIALRTGHWGDRSAELYEGHEAFLEPSFPGPELAIDADGRYLKRSDWSRVPIRHRGVELARVVVRHAGAEHFAFWLSGNDRMSGASSFAIAEQYLELDPGPEDARYSYVDMEELIGDPTPGAYQIEVSAPYRGGLQDSHRFLVSDIQLLAKRASHTDAEVDEVWVWTIDANTAEPIADVNLELMRQNGRVLAHCETDDEGYCELSGNWGDLENEPPFAVVAEGVDELAYIDWQDTKTEIVEGEIGGASYTEDPPYSGSLRGERTLYRPGETMNFVGFLRGDQYRAEPGVPVGVEITDARRQQAYSTTQTTDETGAIEFDYEIPEMAPTGTWSVELFSGDEELARQQISVEEFVPERIEVQVDVDDAYVWDGQALSGQLEAEYFFGTAATDADFEVECSFEPTQPFRERWPQYNFGPFAENVESTSVTFDGRLDGNGEAQFRCAPPDLDGRAVYSVDIKASVFEAGSGRASRAEERTTLLPGDELVGLRSPDSRVDRTDGARLEGIVVGPDGEIVDDADAINLELGSIRYSWTRMYRQGRTRWERVGHESVDEQRQIDVEGGRFSLRAAPRGTTVGLYFRAEHLGTVTELEVSSPRRYWGWGQHSLDPRPDDPAHIQIEGPDKIEVGESAEFSFEAPAGGRALVGVETNRLDSWQWLDVEPGNNSWDISVEYFDPNVYVSVLYVPTGENAPAEMDRGYGVKRVDIARSRWRADVELDVPDEREPGETLDIQVHSPSAGSNAKVAVAAVDRGILSMASFDFEDTLDQLFTTRALAVDTFDTVGWYADVSPERFGGGAFAPPTPAPQAIMPVKPTAMWSGLVDLDDDGRASIDFPIPDFRGELEISAVVVDDTRIGEASARTTIRDPLALQATAPRFATHGDQLLIPLSVTNTTDQMIDVDVEAQALPDMMLFDDDSAELRILGEHTGTMQLAPEQRGQLLFVVEVVGRAGVPELLFEASGNGEHSRHIATVPIYPDGPSEVEFEHHSTDTYQFDVLSELDGWLATSETTEIWVTSIPRAPAFEHLEHVLHYPRLRLGTNLYNTVARVRPLVYLDELLEAADPGSSSRSINWRISSGIRGIERLQRPSGRFSFWPTGTGVVNPWGQAFVLDMLTSAEEAGHDVPSWVLRDGLDWLDRRVQRRYDIEELDLALWVLSRQGRPNRRAARALLDELPDHPSGRDHERALLATAALHLAGDETVIDDLRELISNPSFDDRTRRFYGDFYSQARHEGLILEVAIEIFGTDHELLEDNVERVADRLVDSESGDLNLHELGWSIAALGRWAEAQSAQIPDARLIAAGEEVEPEVIGENGSRSWRLHRASEYPDVRVVFDDQPEGPVSIFRRTQGVHERAQAEFGSQGVQLQRRIRDANGNRVALSNINVGDLVYVELVASHNEGSTLQNLALVDRIPGGFEIEDPRPEGDVRPHWYDSSDQWRVEHFDVRDDRIEAFGSIREDETVTFVYSMRATTAGTFSHPPAELTSMYQNNRWARIAGESVRIERP